MDKDGTMDQAIFSGGEEEKPPLISDEMMKTVSVYLTITFPTIVSTFGIISNTVNLIIFSKMGLKDGMTIGLWALSFSDLLITLQTFSSSVCYLVDMVYPDARFDPLLIQHVSFSWGQDMMYLISNWTTTFICLERCFCVVSPFRVKALFTKSRSIKVIIFIYIYHIASYIPIFISHELAWVSEHQQNENMDLNSTTLSGEHKVMIIRFSSDRVAIHHTVDILNGAIMPVIQQSIVIVSAVCMIYGLHKSSMVRHTGTLETREAVEEKGFKKQQLVSKLSQKERKLVSVMVSLTIILSICNIPRFAAVYTTLIFPEMNMGKPYENTFVFLWALTSFFSSINASVNIFVYVSINQIYRKMFLNLLGIATHHHQHKQQELKAKY